MTRCANSNVDTIDHDSLSKLRSYIDRLNANDVRSNLDSLFAMMADGFGDTWNHDQVLLMVTIAEFTIRDRLRRK